MTYSKKNQETYRKNLTHASLHIQDGRLQEAINILDTLARTNDNSSEAWLMLASAHAGLGHLDAVIQCCNHVISIEPGNAAAHYNLGIALQQTGKPAAATTCFRQALEYLPERPEIYFYLGNALMQTQKFDEAANCLHRSIELKPDNASTHNSLGAVLLRCRDYKGVVRACTEAIRLAPEHAEAHTNLGAALAELGKYNAAIVSLKDAITINPRMASAHYNLGNVLVTLDRYTEAVTHYKTALDIQPDIPDVHGNLANAQGFQGDIRGALTTYKKALQLNPGDVVSHSGMLLSMLYDRATTNGELLREHKLWNRIHCGAIGANSYFSNKNDSLRPLRIGYVSPDFRNHPVSRFIEPVLATHSHDHFKSYCYYNHHDSNAITKRLMQLSDQWLCIANMTDDAVAQRIQDDRIDILVDLAGHTAGNRLQVFARRPAPVQVTWLGYPATTGLDTIDYRLTDAFTDPPGHEEYHTEQLLRLPGTFLCYQPPENSPATLPPPSLETGYPVFGSFNMLSKVTPEVVTIWASILNAVPGSRLILKNNSFRDRGTCERYLEMFEQHGIVRQRIEIIPWISSFYAHLNLYNRIDIALDTFPYNGTTTTFEALWMGVPVITLAGNRHAGRVGHSLLHSVGLPELSANTPGEYTRLATTLAGNIEKLVAYRTELRSRFISSRLCDANAFTHNLEEAFRAMWLHWCSSP